MGHALLEKIKDKTAWISIVGVGYVGLPSVLLFAEKGFHVTAADTNPRVIALLSEGKSHINDPELNARVPKAVSSGRIHATTDVTAAAKQSDCILISVPTPAENNKPDLRFIEQSAQSIGAGLEKGALVVLESTVYPGACQNVLGPILEKQSGLKMGVDFYLAHCPERMNPGDTQHTVSNTPRIVGGINEVSREAAKALYGSVGVKIFDVANLQTAELVKLVENTQRDVNIAFMSEVARLCEKTGVNVQELADACGTKWNFYKVLPGAGVGGHCLPNNPYYILKAAQDAGVDMPLMRLARKINDDASLHVVDLVEQAVFAAGKKIKNCRVALLGIAYKANVDDVRQSPARIIASELGKKGATVLHHDPLVNPQNAAKVAGKSVALSEALAPDVDVAVFLCKHDAFKKIAPADVKAAGLVDACFLFKPSDFKNYRGVGVGIPRPSALKAASDKGKNPENPNPVK